MKVVIDGYGEYEVLSISYGTNEYGIPVDISVVATKEVVEELIAHNLIGNYNENSIEDQLGNLYWETLSARWPSFQVLNARLCRCYAWNDTPMWDKITQRGI
jgi:hypothetical protein